MTETESELIRAAVVRLRARVLALVGGVTAGTGLFFATAILLLHGGKDVGRHLRLLHHYLPGYDVTWPGALVGFGYGALYGGVGGYVLARLYNRLADRGAHRAEESD